MIEEEVIKRNVRLSLSEAIEYSPLEKGTSNNTEKKKQTCKRNTARI